MGGGNRVKRSGRAKEADAKSRRVIAEYRKPHRKALNKHTAHGDQSIPGGDQNHRRTRRRPGRRKTIAARHTKTSQRPRAKEAIQLSEYVQLVAWNQSEKKRTEGGRREKNSALAKPINGVVAATREAVIFQKR